MNRTPGQHKPYPELVEKKANPKPYWIIDTIGKPWLPTNGMTSLKERKLMVPLVAEARSVARHELAHVLWSPPRLPKLDFDLSYLMAVEDARINLGLQLVGRPVLLVASELAQVTRLAREDLADRNLRAFVLRSIAAQGTNAEASVLGELAGASEEVRDLAYRCVHRVRVELLRARRARRAVRGRRPAVAHFRVAHALASELARQLEPELVRLGYPPRQVLELRLGGEGCCFGHAHHGRQGMRMAAAGAGGSPGGPSGTMTVVVAALPHPAPPPRGGRRGPSRATSEGCQVRYPYRWPIDGAIFRRSARQRGGTVLIDTSGSMSLDAAQVDRMLTASSGAAQIAIYSGVDKVGQLRIVARDGRRADGKDLVPFGRGNIIDEPALEWLARQERPLLWVSDGGVTGIGDTTNAALQHRCQEIVQRNRIRRVKTIDEAAACLARGERRAGAV